jgi:hypothetical protein
MPNRGMLELNPSLLETRGPNNSIDIAEYIREGQMYPLLNVVTTLAQT